MLCFYFFLQKVLIMQFISNTFSSNCYTYFSKSLIGNFYGKTVALLDQNHFKVGHVAQEKIMENAKRVGLIALAIFGLIVACYFAAKYFLQMNKPVNLKDEFQVAKKELSDRGVLDDVDFKKGTSAKIFLTIKHGDVALGESLIIPIDQQLSALEIKQEVIAKIDELFEKIEGNMALKNLKVNVRIYIYLKHPRIGPDCLFSNSYGEVDVYQGKTSGFSLLSASNLYTSKKFQDDICDLMEIPRTALIDAQGEFI